MVRGLEHTDSRILPITLAAKTQQSDCFYSEGTS